MDIKKDDLVPRPKNYKRRVKTKAGRMPYTSMMLPEIRSKLQIIADNTDRSFADVLEVIVTKFLNELEG